MRPERTPADRCLALRDAKAPSLRSTRLPIPALEAAGTSSVAPPCAPVSAQRAKDESARCSALRIGLSIEAITPYRARTEIQCSVQGKNPYWHQYRACFCPACFQNDGFWHEEWEHRGVLACLVHGLRLVARCPICKRPLSWKRPDLRHCGCGFPLSLWPREPADAGEMAATKFMLLPNGLDGEGKTTQGLSPFARLSLLRALGYAWLGEAITTCQRTGGLAEEAEARVCAAAGRALLRLDDPVSFLICEFPLVAGDAPATLQKVVAFSLWRAMTCDSGGELRDLVRQKVEAIFAAMPGEASVLSYWIPHFVGSTSWPSDLPKRLSPTPCNAIWTRCPVRVLLKDLRDAWLTRRHGQSSRELAAQLNVPVNVISRMLGKFGYRNYGAKHRYPQWAVDGLLGRYGTVENENDYIDVATVMRNGMEPLECVRRMLDPANILHRAIALVQRGDHQELMFAKWMLPCWSSVRVVVPYGNGKTLSDLRWTSVKIAARYLRVEPSVVIRWVEAGHLGIVLPGVSRETMGIQRAALQRMRRLRIDTTLTNREHTSAAWIPRRAKKGRDVDSL